MSNQVYFLHFGMLLNGCVAGSLALGPQRARAEQAQRQENTPCTRSGYDIPYAKRNVARGRTDAAVCKGLRAVADAILGVVPPRFELYRTRRVLARAVEHNQLRHAEAAVAARVVAVLRELNRVVPVPPPGLPERRVQIVARSVLGARHVQQVKSRRSVGTVRHGAPRVDKNAGPARDVKPSSFSGLGHLCVRHFDPSVRGRRLL